ncbi:MAG: hypothetical protein ACON4V_05100 [Parvibaculales bacterium]
MVQRIFILAAGTAALGLVYLSSGSDEMTSAETPNDPPILVMPKLDTDMIKESEMSKEQETRKLLAELRTIPVSEYAVNLRKYERLLELHPGDATFIRKVSFYSQKLTEMQAARGY